MVNSSCLRLLSKCRTTESRTRDLVSVYVTFLFCAYLFLFYFIFEVVSLIPFLTACCVQYFVVFIVLIDFNGYRLWLIVLIKYSFSLIREFNALIII